MRDSKRMLLIFYRNAIANVIKCTPINWIQSEYKKNNLTIQIYTHLFLSASMHLGIPTYEEYERQG